MPTSAAEPGTSPKPAGASFLEVLAGTSAQSSHGSASGLRLVQGRDSDAGDQESRQESAANSQNQTEGTVDPAQGATSQIASRLNIAQASVAQPARANASSVSRTTEGQEAGRQEKTPANSATPIAIGVLPVSVAPVAIAPVTAPPVTPLPAATTPVPSPSNSAQSVNNVPAPKDQTPVGLVEAQTQNESSRTGRVADNGQGTASGQGATAEQNTSATPDARTTTVSQEPAEDASTKSGSKHDGSTACATGFSLPAGITPVALPLSSTTFSIADFLPGVGDASQSAANTTQTGTTKTAPTSVATSSVTSQAASSTGQTSARQSSVVQSSAGQSSSVQSSSASASAPAHGASSAAQSAPQAQHGQNQATAAAQPAAPNQTGSVAAQVQVQVVTAHGATHEATAATGHSDSTAETTHTSERPAEFEPQESAGTAGINTANVIQKMNGTEMRVGMHSAEFGEVSIRTSVSQQQMTAQISVDDGDLGKAISAHIPAMEAKLGGDFGIRALVEVNQSGMSFTGERNGSPQREQGSYAQAAQVESAPAFTEPDTAVTRIAATTNSEYRLDIRA